MRRASSSAFSKCASISALAKSNSRPSQVVRYGAAPVAAKHYAAAVAIVLEFSSLMEAFAQQFTDDDFSRADGAAFD
ncbi:hypothetical protein BIWAKO_02817 [Bosea sp. BIWAKO-01]|nr:hypothetical protein BIWAKO_02817 [Bosea sp. BIWAKO-01]